MGKPVQENKMGVMPVNKLLLNMAIPMVISMLVQALYNVVDRIYLGHLGDGSSIVLTGVGLTFPIVTLIMAFTALFGMGGVPLFSMARGDKDEENNNMFVLFNCI